MLQKLNQPAQYPGYNHSRLISASIHQLFTAEISMAFNLLKNPVYCYWGNKEL